MMQGNERTATGGFMREQVNTVFEGNVELQDLSIKLLENLEEAVFVENFANYMKEVVKADEFTVCKVLHDQSVQEVFSAGVYNGDGVVTSKGLGIAGHVIKTRTPYFSNNVSKDPIFNTFSSTKSEDVLAELCIPVVSEGVPVLTLHYKKLNQDSKFTQENAKAVIAIINKVSTALSNFKMYLSMKNLNQALAAKVEEKEQELIGRSQGVHFLNSSQRMSNELVCFSPEMRNISGILEQVSKIDVNVLLQGEKGVGKELIARKIHLKSRKSSAPFIVINCSIFDEKQLEKEIFGDDFDAVSKKGALELASEGTILLNDVFSLPVAIQEKLLKVLKYGVAHRCSGRSSYNVSGRFIFSTDTDIRDLVKANRFSNELYIEISKIALTVPSLRNRLEDIVPLANSFLKENSEENKSFSPKAIKALTSYAWPGNINELKYAIKRALIVSESKFIDISDFPEVVMSVGGVEAEESEDESLLSLSDMEKKHICNVLNRLNGNKTKTAKSLGITVKTLYNKLHNYGMI
jgi:Nif-specific regulatory protein